MRTLTYVVWAMMLLVSCSRNKVSRPPTVAAAAEASVEPEKPAPEPTPTPTPPPSDQDSGFERTYAGDKLDVLHSVAATGDGGAYLAGFTRSFGAGSSDIWVVKIDRRGGVIWQKRYGTAGTDHANSVRSTLDGGCIVAGQTTDAATGPGGPSKADGLLLKLDAQGKVQWHRAIGDYEQDLLTDAAELPGGGFVACGIAPAPGNRMAAWVVRCRDQGDIVWRHTLAGYAFSAARRIRVLRNSTVLVSGMCVHPEESKTEAWIATLNVGGSVIWNKSLGGPDGDVAMDAIETADGDLVVCGSYGRGNQGSAFWLSRWTSAGVLKWKSGHATGFEKLMGIGISEAADGSLLMSGVGDQGSPWLTNASASGESRWWKKYPGTRLSGSDLVSGADFKDGFVWACGAREQEGWLRKTPVSGEASDAVTMDPPPLKTPAQERDLSLVILGGGGFSVPATAEAVDTDAVSQNLSK